VSYETYGRRGAPFSPQDVGPRFGHGCTTNCFVNICGVLGVDGVRVDGFPVLVETLLWEVESFSAVSKDQLLF